MFKKGNNQPLYLAGTHTLRGLITATAIESSNKRGVSQESKAAIILRLTSGKIKLNTEEPQRRSVESEEATHQRKGGKPLRVT